MRFIDRHRPPPPEPTPEQELLASISLYVNWRFTTKQLTREQKELWARACDAVHAHWETVDGLEYGRADRWWDE